MTFRFSSTDPSASDIGSIYDVGISTRDGSSIIVLDRNLAQQSIDRIAYMCSRDPQRQGFKEATELQEKSKLVQLGTAEAIDLGACDAATRPGRRVYAVGGDVGLG